MSLIKTTLNLLLVSCTLLINISFAQSPIDDAWSAWAENDFDRVELKFKEAIDQNIDPLRAYIGLSYLYQLQQKNKEAWDYYMYGLEFSPNRSAYLHVAFFTYKWVSSLENENSGIIDLLKDIGKNEKENGFIKAVVHERLGAHYKDHAQLDLAIEEFDKMGSIDQWKVMGPFDNTSASGFDKVFPPEAKFEEGITYEGKNGVPAKWFEITKIRPDRWVDFERYFAFRNSVFYANTFVYSPIEQVVHLRVGTSGSLKAFLNDELMIAYFDENNNDLDTYIAETKLQKGWNRVLIKVGFSELNNCNFLTRITDPKGFPISNLKISTEMHDYPVKPNVTPKPVPVYFEAYFEKQVNNQPQQLENYLLLADAYLKNDKAGLAEETLIKALKIAPNNTVFLNHLLEAYTRDNKGDEINTTIERLNQLTPNLPVVLTNKMSEYVQNKNIDKAEEYLKKIEEQLPGSLTYYANRASLYAIKAIPEKIIEASNEAYEKFPEQWEFVNMKALISNYLTRNFDESIEIVGEFAKKHTTKNVLNQLASFYLKASKTDEWEETFEKMIEYNPAAVGFYYSMANTFFSMQRYEKAEDYTNQTLEICPNSSLYWGLLGDIKRATGEIEKAREAYETALLFNPTSYKTRDKLTSLNGEKSPFQLLGEPDIDALISTAPTRDAYPNQGGVYLVDYFKRVVYERGASEYSQEILVKIFNNDGVSDFTEYWIAFNNNSEELTVDKAVVIKKDGSQIPADINTSQLVFKSIEPGNFVHIKWHIRSYQSGKLSNQIWDQYYFNSFYPTLNAQYALIAPHDFPIHYKMQNSDIEPEITEDNGRKIYKWQLKNQEALQYEYGMPVLDDVGKILFVSSIDSWEYLVNWYLDISKAKCRTTFEIEDTVQKLFKNEGTLDDLEKVRKVYDYITENIQYSSVPFRQSALTPQKARDVLVNKIGDCKDMATICIAMLSELDIKSYYVLVNTWDHGLNRNALPSISFNHAIVAAEVGDSLIYMDLTAHNYPFKSLPLADQNAFALLIKEGETQPFYLKNFSLKSTLIRTNNVTLEPDNSVHIKINTLRTGATTAGTRDYYRNKDTQERNKIMSGILNDDYNNVVLGNFELEDLTQLSDNLSYNYDFVVKGYISDAGGFKFLKLPWTDAVKPSQAFSQEKRTFPFNYYSGVDVYAETLIVALPEGFTPVEVPKNVSYSCPAADYSVEYSYAEGQLKAVRTLRNKKGLVSPQEFPEFKEFYNKVIKNDDLQILLKKK